MTYTVLARRYRSATFEDIVGQEPIAKTLHNAIEADRTAHAYLFTGTRGVGKTSMARIFARELNRSTELQEEEEIAQAILRGDDLDVIEIDGASNRGVQEARDLIAASGLAPTRCRYRIYIIDEVHMLTTPAFNALLKTMEEPPSHVKFILCTTEPHKVPATIQSRCQRFDFRAIPTSMIASHLAFILKEEGVQAHPEVIAEVARLGNGSMRDSLSILDRLLAGGAKTIELEEMEELLGLPSANAVSSLCDAISTSSMQLALESADALVQSGISLDRVLVVIASALRQSLIARVCGTDTSLLELSDESRTQAKEIGDRIDESTLTHMIALCDASSRQVRRGGTGRALFDATIARLCMVGELAEAGNVLKNEVTQRPAKKKKRESRIKTIQKTNPQMQTDTSAVPSSNSNVKEITCESLLATIAATPGLKKIADHLALESFERHSLRLKITESGKNSAHYILAQRQRIEEVVSEHASRKINVVITSDSTIEHSNSGSELLDAVEGHELVQAARGLFDGTVVQVKNINKDAQ